MSARPNTIPQFKTFIESTPLLNSPLLLRAPAWLAALRTYPGRLPAVLAGILTFGCEIGSDLELPARPCKNQVSCFEDQGIITKKILEELTLGRICISTSLVVTSPLGLILKADGEWCHIHNLSHPLGESVNCHIPPEYAMLEYTTVNAVLGYICEAS